MPYRLMHRYVADALQLKLVSHGNNLVSVRCDYTTTLRIRYPGRLILLANAHYFKKAYVDDESLGPDDTTLRRSGWNSTQVELPLSLTLTAPDGSVFADTEVALSDLARHRDPRGETQGYWTLRVVGKSETVTLIPGHTDVALAEGASVRLSVEETVLSQSAAPLVISQLPPRGSRSFQFDLFRLGRFVARVRSLTGSPWTRKWQGQMRLKDPTGAVRASSVDEPLSFDVSQRAIDASRGNDGAILPWTLEVETANPPPGPALIAANVVATSLINAQVIHDRLIDILGANGEKVAIYAVTQNGRVLLKLRILDERSAEFIDMHGLIDSLVRDKPQESHIDTKHLDIRANEAYTIGSIDPDVGYGISAQAKDLKIQAIKISVGPSERIQPAIPALRVSVEVQGHLLATIGGFPLATGKVRNNSFVFELGVKLDAAGTIVPEVWVPDSAIDIDLHWAAAVAAGVLGLQLLLLGADGAAELIESEVNSAVRSAARKLCSQIGRELPRVMASFMGCDLSYSAVRLDDGVIAFDYSAPLEPDPRPSPIYRGVIGRAVQQVGPDLWIVNPPIIPDTWSAARLQNVDHIVVVMMENRSFDHVLGYLGEMPGSLVRGITDDLRAAVGAAGHDLPKLKESLFASKTQFPVHVGHGLSDVREQLTYRLTLGDGPNAEVINSPQGFVENFKKRLDKAEDQQPFVKLDDVLGYYEGDDLPFFRYLVENYAYSDSYYCSHAGPTLPNRFFWLTGDVQYDRAGEAILDNNDGDNLYLSRALTIFDVLSRKGIAWRVYESPPSVAMLRMFSRYATNDTNIVPIGRLQADVDAGDLPPLTIIEPAMHHHPQNDDHPIAEMLYGQQFLKDIYETLRSNPLIWAKTLLIITYDEHGGFYDHIVPPVADLRNVPQTSWPSTPLRLSRPGSAAAVRLQDVDGLTGEALFAAYGHVPEVASASMQRSAAKRDVVTPYGVRVPAFVVSPWVPAGRGPSMVLDHTSILKTVLARFLGKDNAPFMSDRVYASRSFDAFLTEPAARMMVGPAPDIPMIPARSPRRSPIAPLSRAAMRRGNVDFHDLTARLAWTLGRKVR